MRKQQLFAAFAALSISGVATAETYTVTGGNWDDQRSWNTNATGTPNILVYDASGGPESIETPAHLGGAPNPAVTWSPSTPAIATGTYSGTIETNASNEVIGGSLTVTGTIQYEVRVGGNSWWSHEYTDLVIDFAQGTATTSAYQCFETFLPPAACAAGGASPASNSFSPVAGAEGVGGTSRPAATFDGTTLIVFHEAYSAPGPGTDYMNTFTLTSTTGGGGPVAPASDVTEAGAAGGDGDFALLELSSTTGPSGAVNPQVRVIDGSTGNVLNTIEYFDLSAEAWQPIAIDTISDGNSDGTADDPAVVMLAENMVNGLIKVQARYVSNGAKVRTNIPFFNATWSAIDVAVVNDINGDGTTGDTGIAVLAKSDVDGRHEVRMTPLGTVNNLPSFSERFFTPAWTAKAVEGTVSAGGGDSVIVVLAQDAGGNAVAQKRLVSSGASQSNTYGWGAAVDAKDLTIVADGNSDGTANDPAVVFYGDRASNGNPVVRARLLSDSSIVDEFGFLGSAFASDRITSMPSANGNAFAELAGSAVDGGSVLNVRLRDYSTRWVTSTLQP